MIGAAGGPAARLVLALDGATDTVTVALVSSIEGSLVSVAEHDVSARRSHAALFLPAFEAVLRQAGCRHTDIKAVVAGIGPGTFTGVRIGVATARALALALSVPVYGVSSLSALAAAEAARLEAVTSAAARAPRETVPDALVPVLDARRGEVFTAPYIRGAESWSRRGRYESVPLEGLIDWMDGRVGPGGRSVVGPADVVDSIRVTESDRTIRTPIEASHLILGQDGVCGAVEGADGREEPISRLIRDALEEGTRARGMETRGETGSPETVVPIYVRSPDADAQIRKMKDPWKA